MTCTLNTSPAARPAAAPASTAARTLPTSPWTNTEHNPLPTLFQPTNSTLAAFSMASVACTSATRPFVSIIPIASLAISSLLIPVLCGSGCWDRLLQHAFHQRIVRTRDYVRRHQFARVLRGGSSGIHGGAHAAHVSAYNRGHEAAADLHRLHQFHAGRLPHRIACLDQSDQIGRASCRERV